MSAGDGESGISPGSEGLGDLGDLFEDLEQQAAGMHLAERDAELLDRARGEYAAVTLASRVHASLGHHVVITLTGGDVLAGTVVEAGVDWCTVSTPALTSTWLLRLPEVALAEGLSARAVPEAARSVVARLGFGSALHRLAAEWPGVVLHQVTGVEVPARVVRIGADFAEVRPERPDGTLASPVLVPFAALRAARGVQSR